MRPSELGVWAALWSIDPWGELRGDMRSAIVAALIGNVNRDSRKRAEPFKPADFMPYLDLNREPAEQTRDLSRRLRATLGALGAGRKKKGKR